MILVARLRVLQKLALASTMDMNACVKLVKLLIMMRVSKLPHAYSSG